METVWQDMRYGARMLARSRGFTAVAVLTLALGIGANSAIFSFVNAILLQPLPYPGADRLVFLTEWSEQVPNMSFSVENFSDLRDQSRVFDGLMASRNQNYILTGAGEPERLSGRQSTVGLFRTMGLMPIVGRVFTAEDDRPGAERVVLLGEGFWMRRFGRDPSVVGRPLVLNNEPYTVIGVLPGTMHTSWRQTDVWTSLGRLEDELGGAKNRGNHPGIYVMGRLKPGVTVEQARAEVVALAKRLAEQYPDSNARQSMTLRPALEALVGDLRPALLILVGAVGFVLLIACANVANLLLARAVTRQKEIAVRMALGAGRARIVRQLLTESVLLSVGGGLLGLVLAYGGMRALVGIMPANTPRLEGVSLDRVVLGFTLLVSMASGLVFGLIPALQTAAPDTSETLKEGGRGSSGGPARHRARALLVVSEVALALVLLIGAGLMLKSFVRLLDADPGFSSDRVMVMTVNLPQARYDQPAKSRAFFEQVRERLQGTQGIEALGITTPLLGGWQTGFRVEGRPEPPPGQGPSTDINRVGGEFFRAMGIRLIRGRYFTEQDREGQPLVCIVDETMAKTHWLGEDPVGKRLRLGGGHGQEEKPWLTVVGVVAHVKNYGVDQESRVETYLPALQDPIGFATVVVKTTAEPAGLAAAVRAAVQGVDKDVPVFSVRPLSEIMADGRAPKRLSAQLLGAFAALALLLAAIGIYGVMSYSVTQQTLEIGIRVALGAQRSDILKMVVGQGMALAGIGVTLGLALAFSLAFGLAEALSTILFRVSRTDPPTYALVPVVLTIVALLACYVPARRALRVEPIRALRYE
jgi:putative ABC transport system permease protein